MTNQATALSPLRVSDRERENTAGMLREHHLAGRLSVEEFEERVAEAWRARFSSELWWALRELPPPPPVVAPRPSSGNGTASLVLGILAMTAFVLSFGFFWPLALALSGPAWVIGRKARRRAPGGSGAAATGEVLGAVCTILCLIVMGGCAALLA